MKNKNPWIPIPDRPINQWIGEWLVSSFVINAWDKKKGPPKRIRLVAVKGRNISYDVKW